MLTQENIIVFHANQLKAWPEAAARYNALGSIISKEIDIDGFPVTVIHNPARMRSSAAKVDKASIASRPCFLCAANRPPQQSRLGFKGYSILVNPFPILPRHFTIVAEEHRPQAIEGAVSTMVELSRLLPEFAIFYNGPACGASAPDHFHFQAVEKCRLPLFNNQHIPFRTIRLSGEKATQEYVDRELAMMPMGDDETEPKVNIFCTSEYDTPTITIIPRRKHRPDFYGEDGMLVSPASIDLAGVFVAPRIEDFDKFNHDIIKDIYHQLCY